MRFHWQNLNDKKRGRQGLGLIHGRAWFSLGETTLHWEWHLWSKSFRFGFDFGGNWGDDDVMWSFAVPPVSFYFGISLPFRSRLKRFLPKEPRECRIAIHNWALWINPWSNPLEWKSRDPWWRKGKTIHIDDLLLGKQKYAKTEVKPPQRIEIELDRRVYHGIAKFEHSRWKRPLWFAHERDSTWVEMDRGHGLPHSGKGENSWDCGDDALCGWGVDGHDVPKAIGHGIESVLNYRKKYGKPSKTPSETEVAAQLAQVDANKSENEDCASSESR